MVFKKGEVAKKVTKVKSEEVKPNLIRVKVRGGEIKIIDANKEKDYKTKYLHISGNEFID